MARDITRTIVNTNRVRTTGICSVTKEEYAVEVDTAAWLRWQSGELIQVAMPNLNDDQREFLMSGITPAEWETIFEEPED